MSTTEIQEKVKYVSDKHGRNREVILPYKLFRELMELKVTMEIYKQEDVQKSLKKSKRQVREGKGKSFTSAYTAIQWLRQ